MNTADLARVGSLVYPIMLAQEAGEIGEAKAAELLDRDIVSYRELKHKAIRSIVGLVESLPSPLISLVEGTKARPASLTKKKES